MVPQLGTVRMAILSTHGVLLFQDDAMTHESVRGQRMV